MRLLLLLMEAKRGTALTQLLCITLISVHHLLMGKPPRSWIQRKSTVTIATLRTHSLKPISVLELDNNDNKDKKEEEDNEADQEEQFTVFTSH
jgi:hypothetical protein